jgi:hypothetical protein
MLALSALHVSAGSTALVTGLPAGLAIHELFHV